MKYNTLIIIFFLLPLTVFSQEPEELRNDVFLKRLDNDKSYTDLRKSIIKKLAAEGPGEWGESVPGVTKQIKTDQKVVFLTFDACGGKNGDGYDSTLIMFLHRNKIPATLFISGKWIDAHYNCFMSLYNDSLFTIGDHGLSHRPCSVTGKSIYGIKGTANPGEVFDEIEGEARKIEAITGKRPVFFRPGTAYTDRKSVDIASNIGLINIGFSVLAGDAMPGTKTETLVQNVLKSVKPGAIVLMHFNHPERNTEKAVEIITKRLAEKGYTFGDLQRYKIN